MMEGTEENGGLILSRSPVDPGGIRFILLTADSLFSFGRFCEDRADLVEWVRRSWHVSGVFLLPSRRTPRITGHVLARTGWPLLYGIDTPREQTVVVYSFLSQVKYWASDPALGYIGGDEFFERLRRFAETVGQIWLALREQCSPQWRVRIWVKSLSSLSLVCLRKQASDERCQLFARLYSFEQLASVDEQWIESQINELLALTCEQNP